MMRVGRGHVKESVFSGGRTRKCLAYKEEGETGELRNASVLGSEVVREGDRAVGFFLTRTVIDWVASGQQASRLL